MGFEILLRDIAFTCVRFLAFSAHAFLFGVPFILLVVLRPVFASLDRDGWAQGRSRVAARIEGAVQASLIASVIATALAIAIQASLLAELSDGELTTGAFRAVFKTSFGQWHLSRYLLLAVLAVMLMGKVRARSLKLDGAPGLWWWLGWMALGLGLLSTHSFTGHAAVASPQPLGLLNDVVHLAFGSVWFAGIVVLAVFLPDAWRSRGDAESLTLLGPIVARFSKVAMISITVVAVTGALNSFFNVGYLKDLVEAPYGISLTVKVVFFLGILAMGGINHFFLSKRLQQGMENPRAGGAQRFFRVTIAIELAIGLTIMGVTGWLSGQAKTRKVMAPETAALRPGSTP